MPVIGERLKSLIQKQGITPSEIQQNDISIWIEDWVAFCLQALADGYLHECFKHILDHKITQKCQGGLEDYEVYQSSSPIVFFTDLLLECNKELEWFGQDLQPNIIKEEIRTHINNIEDSIEENRSTKRERQLLVEYYDSYRYEWLKGELKYADEAKAQEVFYKKAFEVFWRAYNLGFFSDKECQKSIYRESIIIQLDTQSDTINIKQDNCQVVHRHFIDYMTTSKLLAEHSGVYQQSDLIKQIINGALSDIDSHQKTNRIFNAYIWKFLINDSRDGGLKQKNISLTFNQGNQLTLENKDKLLRLIETGQFATIQIFNANDIIFSYSKNTRINTGIIINENVLNTSQVEHVRILTTILYYEEIVADQYRSNPYYGAYDIELRLHQLAMHAIKNNNHDEDEFDINDEIQFSQLGELGIKVYLAALNKKFIWQLRQNEINKGYSLYLTNTDQMDDFAKSKFDVINGMNEFLTQQLEENGKVKENDNYVFCCQKITIIIDPSTINPGDHNDYDLYIDALCKLILLLDKAKLNQLNLYITHLNPSHLKHLSNALHSVTSTTVRFHGRILIEDALLLESINDATLQSKATYHDQHQNNDCATRQHDTLKQATSMRSAKIQVLLNEKIDLRPIKGKIGIQNQHHHQQEMQQKTEVKILRSWQIEQTKETKHQSKHGHTLCFGEEYKSLITWQHIEAAFDPSHPDYDESRLKLGEEIITYHYKGRDLIDLWQRITGDVKLTKQDIIPDKNDMPELLRFYSPYVPKQISHKTLLTIVRHPHLFQDGVHLQSLPESFCFSTSNGALFTNPSNVDENSNPFVPSFSCVPRASLPSAEHFQRLANSAIPSQAFFHQLTKFVSPYHAWQSWRHGFAALNIFNQQGIQALNDVVEHYLQGANQDSMDFLDYFIQVLNYYHYQQIAQLDTLTVNQIQFEYQQQKDYQHGVMDSLSTTSIQGLPNELREDLHRDVVDIINHSAFNNSDRILEDKQYKQLLLSTMLYHHEKLPNKINGTLLIEEDTLFQLFDIIGHRNGIKLMELALSNDSSVVYNVFAMLHDIFRMWGEPGLADFSRCFLSPTINFAALAEPHHQHALRQLLQLSKVQYLWWQQLTLQHAEQSGYADVATLMAAFQHFLDELTALGLDAALYEPYPLQGINNLQIGLNRVVSILKQAKNPAEQLRNLHKLDWSAYGVVYAYQTIKYLFVNADMQLNLAYESEFCDFINQECLNITYRQFDHYHVMPFSFTGLSKLHDGKANQLYEYTLSSFHRYIAYNKYVAPMLVYQQLLAALVLPEKYVVIGKIHQIVIGNGKLMNKINPKPDAPALLFSHLLPIIAYATTGQRALDRLPRQQQQQIYQLQQFIHAVFESARNKTCGHVEMDRLLDENNAVIYENLIEILQKCIEFYPHSHYQNEALESKLQLDLEELTLIVQLIKQSYDYYKLLHNDALKITTTYLASEALFKNTQVIGRTDNQFFYTKQLLNYNHYFSDALNRINHYNRQSDYACFLMVCLSLEKHAFSFENNGRLIRIMSLVKFKIKNFATDACQFLDCLKLLDLYQKNAGTTALNELLSALSCIVPTTNKPLEIARLHTFISDITQMPEMVNEKGIDAVIQLYFKDYRPDHAVDEVKDTDFYPNPNALEQKFSGLGSFFLLIKAIVLQHYPASVRENKLQAWDDFLFTIHQLESSEQQEQVLQTLLHTPNRDLDLTTLNQWLSVLLNQAHHGVRFHPEYFTSLDQALLKHQNKHDFSYVLNKWLVFAGEKLSVSSHSGFIRLLNKMATVKNGISSLENFYRAATAIAELANHEQYPWYDDFIKLIDVWQHQVWPHQDVAIDSLNKICTLLYRFCEIVQGKTQYSSQCNRVLLQWLTNIDQENKFELTLNMAENGDKYPQQSFNIMLILAQVTEPDFLTTAYHALMQMDAVQLAELAACYQRKLLPAPQLLEKLIAGESTVDEFVLQHNCDPHHERNEAKLKQQFDNTILRPYIQRAKYLQPDQQIPLDFRLDLDGQLKFVNHHGKKHRRLHLNDIRQELHACRESVKATNDKERLDILLTALSLIREAVYKTSEEPAILWPTAVQMLAVFSALNHQVKPGAMPLFLQMATGEGKSLVDVILAILTWVNKGGPVTVVTLLASLALRDAKAYAPLFENLGLESEHLTANTKKAKFNGIYFAEFNDLASLRLQGLLDSGQDIDNMSFIIDEGDEIILHNQTDTNLTQTQGSEDTHPHAWVFEALAAYLESVDIQQDLFSVRIADLVNYLRHAHPLATRACQQVEFLIKLPIYLQAVWQARTLEERVDFIPKRIQEAKKSDAKKSDAKKLDQAKKQDSDEYYAAVLQRDKHMPPNVTFNGLIPQALHGWLNYLAKKQQSPHHFPIAPETTLFSSMSPEAVLQWMIRSGTFIALSATIESNSELMEMRQNYGFDFIKLPKMQSSLRIDYPVRFCPNQQQQLQSIAEICTHYIDKRTPSKSRSILIVVKSIDFAETLNEYLQACSEEFHPSVLHAGIDGIDDHTLGEHELISGQSGHILIAVRGLISRGFDIKLSTAKQVVVISTDLKDEVDEIQSKGRCNRVNQTTGLRDKGKFYAVYDLEKECSRYPHLHVTADDSYKNPEAFIQKLFIADYQQESVSRLHRQLVSIGKDTIQNDFFGLWKTLFKNGHVMKEMRDEIMTLFTAALEKITSTIHDALLSTTDFSMLTEQGVIARGEYNDRLLSVYAKALEGMHSILGMSSLNPIPYLMKKLMEKIESQQQKLLSNHSKALATSAKQPDIKIYKQWKPGVKFNAYLDQGKQSTLNYMRGLFDTWWYLSEDEKNQIKSDKIALRQKIQKKCEASDPKNIETTARNQENKITNLKDMEQSAKERLTNLQNVISEKGNFIIACRFYPEKKVVPNYIKKITDQIQQSKRFDNGETDGCLPIKRYLGLKFSPPTYLNSLVKILKIAAEADDDKAVAIFEALGVNISRSLDNIKNHMRYKSKEDWGTWFDRRPTTIANAMEEIYSGKSEGQQLKSVLKLIYKASESNDQLCNLRSAVTEKFYASINQLLIFDSMDSKLEPSKLAQDVNNPGLGAVKK